MYTSEIEHIDLQAYREAADQVISQLQDKIGKYYLTTCLECASPTAYVKYFIWVKTHCCTHCQMTFDLFPNYLLAENRRHPQNVLICSTCGELNEESDRYNPGNCHSCGGKLLLKGPATRRKCQCPSCGQLNSYPEQTGGAPQHRLVAIEYFCAECKSHHRGRFFKKPDSLDLAKYDGAARQFSMIEPDYIPDNEIPPGDETKRLHRWGYSRYREMFNDRQLLGLELSCQFINQLVDSPVRNALITNLSDLLRYQNMLCRYDSMALKSLDIFSIHGFPVGLIQCESNLLGIVNNGVNIGSGGWTNIIDKYARAKSYCDEPFEVKHQNKRRYQI